MSLASHSACNHRAFGAAREFARRAPLEDAGVELTARSETNTDPAGDAG